MDQSVVNGSSRIQLCLELAPIGGQLFAHDNSQRDCTAFRLPIVTYATRLLAQPLMQDPASELRRVAPSRRGPGSSVVTLVGLPMALLLLVALLHGGILSPRESAAPHTNAVFIATFFANFCESPVCEVRLIGFLRSSHSPGPQTLVCWTQPSLCRG